MEIGLIKWFDDLKGFGVLITSDDKEFFMHHSNWKDRVRVSSYNQIPIVFETDAGKERNTAINCTYFNPNNPEHWKKLLSLSKQCHYIGLDEKESSIYTTWYFLKE